MKSTVSDSSVERFAMTTNARMGRVTHSCTESSCGALKRGLLGEDDPTTPWTIHCIVKNVLYTVWNPLSIAIGAIVNAVRSTLFYCFLLFRVWTLPSRRRGIHSSPRLPECEGTLTFTSTRTSDRLNTNTVLELNSKQRRG